MHFAAMVAGIVAAMLVSRAGGIGAIFEKFHGTAASRNRSGQSLRVLAEPELDRQKPQKQAEILLERAVVHSGNSLDQIEAEIESRLDSWRGKLKWDAQLGQLTTAALNSEDRGVRESGVEVQLAAYGVAKSESSVDLLVQQAASSDHAQKIWALWTLGLLANRGVEPDRVVDVLTAHLQGSARDADEDSRHWAVEGLALAGTASTVAPLLQAMHDDPSPLVRERAACSLAESGMLSHELRLTAVPQLINYSEDPALDSQTHAWAFQALGDITRQRVPNDSAAWRNWYQASVNPGP